MFGVDLPYERKITITLFQRLMRSSQTPMRLETGSLF